MKNNNSKWVILKYKLKHRINDKVCKFNKNENNSLIISRKEQKTKIKNDNPSIINKSNNKNVPYNKSKIINISNTIKNNNNLTTIKLKSFLKTKINHKLHKLTKN